MQREAFADTYEPKRLPIWSLKIKLRIGHIELLDPEGENFLFHFLGVIGLEFQVDCLQKVVLIQSGALVDKAEVEVIQLKRSNSSDLTLTLHPRTLQ